MTVILLEEEVVGCDTADELGAKAHAWPFSDSVYPAEHVNEVAEYMAFEGQGQQASLEAMFL